MKTRSVTVVMKKGVTHEFGLQGVNLGLESLLLRVKGVFVGFP